MKTIIANLKNYYQRRSFYAVYLVLSLFICLWVGMVLDYKENLPLALGSLISIPLLWGFIATSMQIEILNKPFSFCLPGHKADVKKVLLLLGVALSLLLSILLFIFAMDKQMLIIFIPIFFMSLIFFWIGVGLASAFRNQANIAAWFWIVFFLFLYNKPFIFIGNLIINNTVLITCIGFLTSIMGWFLLDSSRFHRRFCAVPWVGVFDMWNRNKLQNYVQTKTNKKGKTPQKQIKPSVEKFFLRKMGNYSCFSKGRYIWGGLYLTLGLGISTIPVFNIFIILFALLLTSYFQPVMMFWLLPFIGSLFIPLSLYSNLLISDGRRERFYSCLITSLAFTFQLVIPLLIIILISKLAAPFMPELAFSRLTLVFKAMSLKFLLLPLIIIPVILTVRLIFHKRFYMVVLSLMGLYILSTVILALSGLLGRAGSSSAAFINNIYGVFPAAVILISIWLIFFAVLRHISFKRSLI